MQWNEKVNNSKWISFLDTILWLITCSGYQFKQTLLIADIEYPKLNARKIQSQENIDQASSILSSLINAKMSRVYFRINRNVISIQDGVRAYLARQYYIQNRPGRVGKIWEIFKNGARMLGNGIAAASGVAARQAIRHGPRLVMNYGFKLVLMQICADAGLNYGDVAAQGAAFRMMDNGGRFQGF